MTEFLKKTILFAIGAATIVHEKSEEIIKLFLVKSKDAGSPPEGSASETPH